jgi:hypothetical protein
LCHLTVWDPKEQPNGVIELDEVEDELRRLYKRFGVGRILIDPWQGVQMWQNLNRGQIKCDRFTFGFPKQDDMAARLLLSLARDGLLQLWYHPLLISELRGTSYAERANGNIRLIFPRSSRGAHGDTVVATMLAIVAASEASAPQAPTFAPRMVGSAARRKAAGRDLGLDHFRAHIPANLRSELTERQIIEAKARLDKRKKMQRRLGPECA